MATSHEDFHSCLRDLSRMGVFLAEMRAPGNGLSDPVGFGQVFACRADVYLPVLFAWQSDEERGPTLPGSLI